MSEESESARGSEKRLPVIRIAAIVLVGVLTAIVVFQNTESVETRILFATIVMPRAVLLLTTFALGFALGIVSCYLRRRTEK